MQINLARQQVVAIVSRLARRSLQRPWRVASWIGLISRHNWKTFLHWPVSFFCMIRVRIVWKRKALVAGSSSEWSKVSRLLRSVDWRACLLALGRAVKFISIVSVECPWLTAGTVHGNHRRLTGSVTLG